MPTIADRLNALGIELPPPPARGGLYTPVKLFGNNLAYLSGCGPAIPGEPSLLGKVGANLTPEEGKEAARRCALNALAVLQRDLGSLDRIECVAKMLAFVASADSFTQQPQVANGASELLVAVLGEAAGCPARSAIGVNVLPGDIPVEVELLIALRPEE